MPRAARAGGGTLAFSDARAPAWTGFSLFELVTVMAIAAALAAIAVPRYGESVGRHRAESAARRVAATLTFAGATARQTSRSVTVVFDASAGEVRLIGVPDSDSGTPDHVVRIGDEPYKAQMASVDFGGDNQVVFSGFGIPDTGGTLVVGVGDSQRTIVLDAATGRASTQ